MSNSTDHRRLPLRKTSAARKRRKTSLRQQPEPVMVSDNIMNKIPQDVVVTKILARVASSSLLDLLNANQTCKFFRDAGKDNWVFQHVSMDALQVVQWKNSSDHVSSFLKRCEEAQNPEALYRLGMVEFFNRKEIETGRELLQKASDLGHTVATYMLGIVLLDSSDEQTMRKGRELLNNVLTKGPKRSRNEEVQDCREKSLTLLRQLWINEFLHRPKKIKCDKPTCMDQAHKKRNEWSPNKGYDEDVVECEACKCNRELILFCDKLGIY
ncbi:hypothetical protein BVC80_233g27 [Macleaya cordata]|uniref:At2g35280-like TPR domain-containing protein n=1 Tax=Macleaya cordata TaxID=56857 RepID=A0A200RB29_MACCD|nr:hypothetical protein BVC80_233g27 [Macleaya cordata]